MTTTNTPEARKAYRAGWQASIRAGEGVEGVLDRADGRGVPNAWYDGYMDYACDRMKYHNLTCPQVGECQNPAHYW